MKTRNYFIITMLLAFAGGLMVTGCSSEEEPTKIAPSQQLVQSVAESVVNNVAQAELKKLKDSVKPAGELAEEPVEATNVSASGQDFPKVHDFEVIGPNLYAVTDAGLVIYDFVARSDRVIETDSELRAIASHGGKLYVGGDGLFVFEDSALVPVDIELPPVTDLESYTFRLLIGTRDGLHSLSIFGNEEMLPDYSITDIAPAGDGFWVGTDGSGLFGYNGIDFKKRYLTRDTTVFDFVTALDYNHHHTYVGTPDGLWVFDGGMWQSYTVETGMPANGVTAIDASYWVVTVGTENGTTSLFKGDLMPVQGLDNIVVTALARYDKKVIAGTANDFILIKSGPVVRPLIDNVSEKTIDLFSAIAQ